MPSSHVTDDTYDFRECSPFRLVGGRGAGGAENRSSTCLLVAELKRRHRWITDVDGGHGR